MEHLNQIQINTFFIFISILIINLILINSTEGKISNGAGSEGLRVVEKDLSLNLAERQALDEFKRRLGDSLPQDYMKSDIFLIKWLRATKLNQDKAVAMLESNIAWRKMHDLDNILKEDFSKMEQDFPMDLDGVDFNGSPVIATTDIRDGDFRKVVLTGQTDQLYRYMMSRIELAAKKVRDAQDKGLNVTRFQFIENLQGFNLAQHACIQCMPIHLKMIQGFQNHYPGMVDRIVYVNAPGVFDVALRIALPIASEELRNSLKIFGTNKSEWQKYIFDIIPPDQLDPVFGGTKVSSKTV